MKEVLFSSIDRFRGLETEFSLRSYYQCSMMIGASIIISLVIPRLSVSNVLIASLSLL